MLQVKVPLFFSAHVFRHAGIDVTQSQNPARSDPLLFNKTLRGLRPKSRSHPYCATVPNKYRTSFGLK